jgi:hypothetical protein
VDTGELTVEFLGEEYPIPPGAQLSFGRAADLVIDDNRHLHRRLGQFEFADGLWWLHNLGSSMTMELIDRNSPARLTLPPGATVALIFEECAVRFEAGAAGYEIEVDVPIEPPTPGPADHRSGGDPVGFDSGAPTVTGADLTFTADQLRCVLALAEPRLIDPSSGELPTSRAAAARLGWKLTKFNRKLDNVCAKVGKAGVSGLHGDLSDLATNRRQRLVDFAVTSQVVTRDDLALLESG